MKEIQKSVWFKGKFRNDPVTFGLLLKSGVEGKLLNRVPEVIKIMDRDGLKMTPQTAHTVIQAAVKNTVILFTFILFFSQSFIPKNLFRNLMLHKKLC